MQRLIKEDLQIANRRSVVERFIERSAKKGIKLSSEPVIKVVFHIVYHLEEEKISESQVHSQMQALTRDFNSLPESDFHPAIENEGWDDRIANPGIAFELCTEDPDGNLNSGIIYYPSPISQWTADDAIKEVNQHGADAWNTSQYLNIWVGRLVDSITGYAQMPGGPGNTDGIVIDYRFLGTLGTVSFPYDEGKTLTHLVGNYLNLYSLWNSDCLDDYVSDTPLHRTPNFGCPFYRHISACDNSTVEMSMNFMDNSDDACLKMFTIGQKIRMLGVLMPGGIRHSLLQKY